MKSPMVEGDMGKFESQISLFKSGGEFFIEHLCTFEAWKHSSNSWSIAEFSLSKGLAKVKFGGIVDGS